MESNNLNNVFFYDFPCIMSENDTFINNIDPNLNLNLGNNVIDTNNPLIGQRPSNSHINNRNTDPHLPHLQLSRHHVIPMNTFMRFFRAINLLGVIKLNNITNNTGENGVHDLLRENINEIANIYIDNENDATLNYYSVSVNGSSGGGIVSPHNIVRTIFNINNQELLNGGTVRVNVDFNHIINNELLFSTLVAWIPGNIFLGPILRIRIDDPGSDFEINSRYIIGNERYDILRELYENMTKYELEVNNMELLISILNAIKKLCRLSVVKFNSDQWDYNTSDDKKTKKPKLHYKDFKIKIPRFMMKRSIEDNNKEQLDYMIGLNNYSAFQPLLNLYFIKRSAHIFKEVENNQIEIKNLKNQIDVIKNVQNTINNDQNTINKNQNIINHDLTNKIINVDNYLRNRLDLIHDTNNYLRNRLDLIYDMNNNLRIKKDTFSSHSNQKYNIKVYCEPNYLFNVMNAILIRKGEISKQNKKIIHDELKRKK